MATSSRYADIATLRIRYDAPRCLMTLPQIRCCRYCRHAAAACYAVDAVATIRFAEEWLTGCNMPRTPRCLIRRFAMLMLRYAMMLSAADGHMIIASRCYAGYATCTRRRDIEADDDMLLLERAAEVAITPALCALRCCWRRCGRVRVVADADASDDIDVAAALLMRDDAAVYAMMFSRHATL